VIAADTTGAQTLHHQEQMMGEIGKLLDTANGELDPKDYDRTVSELLSGGSDRSSPRSRRRVDARRLRSDEVKPRAACGLGRPRK